jgi:2-dehydro-3-deoxyphosphogluconate aldolase / (4S)-4-hydroxy-2-oxoglutarate aldolase
VRAVAAIARQRVVPVVRAADAADAVLTARAAAAAGMTVVELTLTTPSVHAALRELRDDGLVLGLGSVVRPTDVGPAVAAGAEFVVSFASVTGLVASAREAGVAAVCGAFTPTEVLAAHMDGADAVKIFPARLATPAYLRDLASVQPGVRLMPTGGIGADEAHEWLAAGAWAVGLGGTLGTVAVLGAGEVERRCRAALAAAHRLGNGGDSD